MKIADRIGWGFSCIRKDGRKFSGIIQDVRPVKDRTLIILRQNDNSHKSIYAEDCEGMSFSLENGQPVSVA